MWKKIKSFFVGLWHDLKDWKTFILFLIVCLVIGAPVWVPLLLGIIFKNGWLISIAGAVEAFWLAPFTPFIPLCVTITFIIKKILNKIFKKT